MDLLEQLNKTEFLGREFLTWLWFKSETSDGKFDLGETGEAQLWFCDRVTLKSEGSQSVQTVTCCGENSDLREARYALAENKKVTQAKILLVVGDEEWTFSLDSTWLNFKSLKTPQIEQDTKEDPEGLFLEKVSLINKAVSIVETIFLSFIKLRTSQAWHSQDLPAISDWIKSGKAA